MRLHKPCVILNQIGSDTFFNVRNHRYIPYKPGILDELEESLILAIEDVAKEFGNAATAPVDLGYAKALRHVNRFASVLS